MNICFLQNSHQTKKCIFSEQLTKLHHLIFSKDHNTAFYIKAFLLEIHFIYLKYMFVFYIYYLFYLTEQNLLMVLNKYL